MIYEQNVKHFADRILEIWSDKQLYNKMREMGYIK